MSEYGERDKARQAVLIRANFGQNVPAEFPVPLKLSRCKQGDEPSAWASKAGDVYANPGQAAYADWMDTPEYSAYWRALGRASSILKATTIKASDYAEPIMYNDKYYEDVDALLDDLADDEEDKPAWVWATKDEGFHFNIEDAIGSYLSDNHHEDAELDHMDELLAFWREWSAKQTLRTFWESHKRIVVIDEAAFAVELEDARKTLEIPPAVASPYVANATTTPQERPALDTPSSPAVATGISPPTNT